MGRPPLTWEVFEVQAAGGCSVPQGTIIPWPGLTLLHQHVMGDSRGQRLLRIREVLPGLY